MTLLEPIDFGDNPYLVGPHAPIRKELDQPDLKVVGQVPNDFSGI